MKDQDYYDERINDKIVTRIALQVETINRRFPNRHKGSFPGHNAILIRAAIKNLRLQIRLAERLGFPELIVSGYKIAGVNISMKHVYSLLRWI